MANAGNLMQASDLTPEERRERARNGGIASGVSRRRKKSVREAVDHILSLPVARKSMKRDLERFGITEDDADYQAAIVAAMVREAMDGDVKAAKLLVELAEESEQSAGRDTEDDPLTASLKEMMREL